MPGRPRKTLPMSDEEIRREYRQAKDPKKQLLILADENDCSVGTILRIVNLPQPPTPPGFVPTQELLEKEKEKETAAAPSEPGNDGEENNVEKEIDLPPAPSEPGNDGEENNVEKEIDLPPARPYSPESGAAPQAAPLEYSGETSSPKRSDVLRFGTGDLGPSSLPDVQDLPGLSAFQRRYFLSEEQLMELWFVLGRLRGVLDASAEAGKPGDVMKDATDELESLLRSLH